MHIRLATNADLPAIVAIFNASIPGRQATAVIEPVTVDQRREWFNRHSPDRNPIWVGEREHEAIVGWISLTPFMPERPAYSRTAELSVYINPEVQRQGIGLALSEHALRIAPTLGLQNVVSLIFGHNAASLRLHEKLGFQRWGMLPGVAELDQLPRDVVILGKRVTLSS
jgi:phosphinothricin acetyltransferase